MAIVNIPATNTTHRDPERVTAFLATYGNRFSPVDPCTSGGGRCAPQK